jgi:hypothetical protein
MSTQQGNKPQPVVTQEGVGQFEGMSGLPRAQREHVAGTSADIVEVQVEKLRHVFPKVFVEGKIDFDRLRLTLGAAAETGPTTSANLTQAALERNMELGVLIRAGNLPVAIEHLLDSLIKCGEIQRILC